jgi:hypothetical protein
MSDATSPGGAGRASQGTTPAEPAMSRTQSSPSEESAVKGDSQAIQASSSEAISKPDQPELKKANGDRDGLLFSEKPPNIEHDFRVWAKDKGIDVDSYLNEISEATSSTEIYKMWVSKLGKYAESYDKSPASERAPRLARSFIDYVRTVDDRLDKIESKMGINAKSTKAPEDTPGKEHTVQTKFYNASAQPQSQSTMTDGDEIGWNEKGTFLSEVDPKHCLRVLFNWVHRQTSDNDAERDDEHPDAENIEISDIRIHSEPVTSFIAKQLDYEVQKDGLMHLKRPFRTLIRKVDSIKKQLSLLEQEYGQVQRSCLFDATMEPKGRTNFLDRSSAGKPGTESPGSSSDQHHLRNSSLVQSKASNKDSDEGFRRPSYERREALDDFREIVGFLDKYLCEEISLYKEYSKGLITTIAFERLWMLFDAGDLVYCPFQKSDGTLPNIYNPDSRTENGYKAIPLPVHTPQAYRVLATSGGIAATKRKRPGLSQSGRQVFDEDSDRQSQSGDLSGLSKRDRYTSFFIDCYFIYFDGTRFAPGQNWLEFKPFEGAMKVTNLLAYPMRYKTGDGSHFLLDLHERGRRFLDLTIVDHRHYDGVTLGKDKEEINSPVIIDFKMGLEYNSQWDPKFPWGCMPRWKDEPRQILEIPTRTCSHVDCHRSACLEDAYRAHQIESFEKKMRSLTSQLDELDVPTSRTGPGLGILKSKVEQMDGLDLLPGYGLAYVLRGRKWGK